MSARISISLDEMVLLKADARGFSFLPRQPVSSLLSGRHASRLRGRGLAFEELRHYHPGDDIRLIDWKATARLRSTHVRVFNEERERPVLFVVDQRGPMFFGSQRAMKSVVAAELTALGAWRTLEAGDRVGGIVFNDNEIAEVRPHRSQSRLLQLFHQIVQQNQALAGIDSPTDSGATATNRLNEALQNVLHIAKHDHLVVLISDLDGADSDTHRLSTLIAARNDMLVAGIYDPLGASLRGGSGMVATDREESWEIPVEASFTEKFQQSFQNRLDEWRQVFRNLKIPVIPVSTSTSPAEQIRSLLGH
ncbi:hypothetical protein Pla110_17770 [Polystyrenella longa]|uniref:DUF58 domain-containing protein n=1 Tax=Polystyrenella longa TaxID=2528007 RepID=A0A518CLF1_9PLAN|nr:DUF58 domain-containing protein [Polystyrenella longa]QDU80055.1 hypothetical protein Pla110_17770 [Polystyrenella longa]